MDCGWGTQSHAQVVQQLQIKAKTFNAPAMNIIIIVKLSIVVKLRWKIMMLRMMLRGRAGLSS